MHFLHQPLTWGFLLVVVPLLIQLINLLRHRRVRWAAMEFLLQSYKRHRMWIWLQQLLLLVLRMLVVALVVAMLAQWVTQSQWLDFLSGKATHHFVLLDDSYSMSDTGGGTSAFEAALTAIQRIAAQAAAQDSRQRFTLLRFSRAERAGAGGGTDVDRFADFNAERIDAQFDVTLANKRNTFAVTSLAVEPGPALAVLEQLLEQRPDERRLVYLVSDFRAAQWENPADLREALRRIAQTPAEIRLVGCVRETRPNLGLVALAPAHETRAAGVPLFVNLGVQNFGPDPVRNVQVKVRTVFCDRELERTAAAAQFAGKTEELPTVLIENIEPGETVSRRVQVFFPKPGQHVLEVQLPDDPVAVDNRRWDVLDFPEYEAVLAVDGSPEQRHAYFLQTMFQPGGRANTGVRVELQPPAFLRDVRPETVQKYRTIYLLDVPRLDDRAIANLEAYVRGGGGLAFFAGPNVDLAFYTQRLYQDGQGLFPLPLERQDVLPPDADQPAADIEPANHPVFDTFLGERNSFIRLVTIDRFVRPPDGWQPSADSTVQVAAALRNRQPLAVEHQFGNGRVLAFLTTFAPDWNNWGLDPSFVVMVLRLQSHLAAVPLAAGPRLVGSPLLLELEADKFRQDLQFTAPGETPETRLMIDRVAAKAPPPSPLLIAQLGAVGTGGVGETDRRGIYEAWPVTTAGEADVRRWALNVDPREGALQRVEPKQLLANVDPVPAEFRYADEYNYDLSGITGSNWSFPLMMLLVLLLLAEQLVAYLASYHPKRVARV